ncbi:hypothetical protein D3C80_2012890 [compost metagenome]
MRQVQDLQLSHFAKALCKASVERYEVPAQVKLLQGQPCQHLQVSIVERQLSFSEPERTQARQPGQHFSCRGIQVT